MSLRRCEHQAEQLPANVTCGVGCAVFPACLPRLELVGKLLERRAAAEQGKEITPLWGSPRRSSA